MIQNRHPQKGLDYHFRALGFKNRRDLRLIAADDQCFDNGIIVSKPDWVIEDTRRRMTMVIEYKSRVLGSGSPKAYEAYETLIHADVVEDVLSKERDYPVKVSCAILYGDGEIVALDRTSERKVELYERAVEAPTELFFLGVYDKVRSRVRATDMARLLSDPDFTDSNFNDLAAANVGALAHKQVRNIGPKISTIRG